MTAQTIGAPADLTLKLFRGAGASGIPPQYLKGEGMVLQLQKPPAAAEQITEPVWIDITTSFSGTDTYDYGYGTHQADWDGAAWRHHDYDKPAYLRDFIRVNTTQYLGIPLAARVTYTLGRTGVRSNWTVLLLRAGSEPAGERLESSWWGQFTQSGQELEITWNPDTTYEKWYVEMSLASWNADPADAITKIEILVMP